MNATSVSKGTKYACNLKSKTGIKYACNAENVNQIFDDCKYI